ncbi:MAG: hypothetical protein RLZZ303_767 [Candidatus Hydrogenedentota bacterium]|jgi:lipopolysaccharide export system permease protein
MTRYDRHLTGRLLVATFQCAFALFSLFVLIDFLSIRLDRMQEYETPASQMALYYATLLPTVLFEYQILAVSVLVAGLIVLGKAAQSNEVVALLAAGVSLRRIALAPLCLALLLSVAGLMFAETAGVRLTRLHQEIASRYVQRADAARHGSVSWVRLSDGWTCHVLDFNPIALTGQDVFIHRNTSETLDEIRAHRIYWEPESKQWLLEDGRWFATTPGEDWRQQVTRITQQPAPFTDPPEQLFALQQSPATRSIVELRNALDEAGNQGAALARGWLAWHRKLAQPFLCAIMMLLAVPFAVRYRRGGVTAGFGMGIGIAMGYMLVFYGGVGLAYLLIVPPVAGVWAANVLFAGAGGWMLLRAPS